MLNQHSQENHQPEGPERTKPTVKHLLQFLSTKQLLSARRRKLAFTHGRKVAAPPWRTLLMFTSCAVVDKSLSSMSWCTLPFVLWYDWRVCCGRKKTVSKSRSSYVTLRCLQSSLLEGSSSHCLWIIHIMLCLSWIISKLGSDSVKYIF